MSARTHLKIYALPSIRGKYVFHAQFLAPKNRVEQFGLITSYITRKWRFQISDYFGMHWHMLSHPKYQKSKLLSSIYSIGNKMTSRKCLDEYFFKQIPTRTTSIEIIYPESANEDYLKKQIQMWLIDSSKFGKKSLTFALLLPTNFYIAKFYLFAANILFSYHLFRLNAAIRSHFGAKQLQKLIDEKKVEFVPSKELHEKLVDYSNQVVLDDGTPFHWKPDTDVHDEVAEKLSIELKVPELIHSVRRSRLIYTIYKDY
ncbi:hypothetical protein BC833DRAFT_607562 [Globomyces pollinis-pini]|nr:hypothetical protein BC833DRAFT_607562 [Globomyces pollinis-pini]KAJ2991812.1 hypothetical protein HDV02_003479 [Globomyces sp. JEL0801]